MRNNPVLPDYLADPFCFCHDGRFYLYYHPCRAEKGGCLFRGSKVADIRTGHTSYFGIRFNTSIGSRRFLETIRPKGYSRPAKLSRCIALCPARRSSACHGRQR